MTTEAIAAGLGQLCTCKAAKGVGARSCRGGWHSGCPRRLWAVSPHPPAAQAGSLWK